MTSEYGQNGYMPERLQTVNDVTWRAWSRVLYCVHLVVVVLRQKVGESLRGEMTAVESHKKLFHFSLIEHLADTMRISSAEVSQTSPTHCRRNTTGPPSRHAPWCPCWFHNKLSAGKACVVRFECIVVVGGYRDFKLGR